jgi:hypothetical protein
MTGVSSVRLPDPGTIVAEDAFWEYPDTAAGRRMSRKKSGRRTCPICPAQWEEGAGRSFFFPPEKDFLPVCRVLESKVLPDKHIQINYLFRAGHISSGYLTIICGRSRAAVSKNPSVSCQFFPILPPPICPKKP